MGFRCGEGSNFGLFHWLASSPLKHSRTTVRVCDYNIIVIRDGLDSCWLIMLLINFDAPTRWRYRFVSDCDAMTLWIADVYGMMIQLVWIWYSSVSACAICHMRSHAVKRESSRDIIPWIRPNFRFIHIVHDFVQGCTRLRKVRLIIANYGAICPHLLPDGIAYCTKYICIHVITPYYSILSLIIQRCERSISIPFLIPVPYATRSYDVSPKFHAFTVIWVYTTNILTKMSLFDIFSRDLDLNSVVIL